MAKTLTQRERALNLMKEGGIVRLREFQAAGITAATIGRMCKDGDVSRLAWGLYQLPDAPLNLHHTFAEAAKRQPNGVICLVSALEFHDLTDQLPSNVWMAVRTNAWAPKPRYPPVQVVRFADAFLEDAVLTERIEGVDVKVFGVAKTIADCFRHRRKIGLTVAIEGLQETIRQRKATPAEIARHAVRGRVWTVVRPYLEALIANR